MPGEKKKKKVLNTRKLIRGAVLYMAPQELLKLENFFVVVLLCYFKKQHSYKACIQTFKLWEYVQHLHKIDLILKGICCHSATCKNQGGLKNSVYLTSLLCVGGCAHLHSHMYT